MLVLRQIIPECSNYCVDKRYGKHLKPYANHVFRWCHHWQMSICWTMEHDILLQQPQQNSCTTIVKRVACYVYVSNGSFRRLPVIREVAIKLLLIDQSQGSSYFPLYKVEYAKYIDAWQHDVMNTEYPRPVSWIAV